MGRKDIPLLSLDEDNFSQSIKKINEFGVDTILHSPLLRAKQTLEIISPKINFKDIIEEHQLIERDFGFFEGKEKNLANRNNLDSEGTVENIEDFRNRIFNFYKSYSNSNKRLLIIGHSAFYRESVQLLKLNNRNSIACCEAISLNFPSLNKP